jgi:putative phage-type endonuclease
MAITPAQRAGRRSGIGGSDAAGILGKSARKTPLSVYDSKVHDFADEQSEFADLGNELEPVIRRLAAKKLGLAIEEPTETLRHPEHDWMLANLDGVTSDGGVFEAKAVFDWVKAKELGPEGSDWVLPEHFIQVQHYMEVAGLPHAHVAYFVNGKIQTYRVAREREIGAVLVQEEGRFWREHVLARVPPDETNPFVVAEFLGHAFQKANGERLTAEEGGVAEATLLRLREARAAEKAAKQMVESAKNEVKLILGDAARIDCAFGHVTWTAPMNGRTAWREVARTLKPPKDLIAKFTKPASRRFVASFDGESDDSSEE